MSVQAELDVAVGEFRLVQSIQVATGRVLALLGANGVGKTTLLRALAGLEPIDAGRILIDGKVVDDPAAGVFVAPSDRHVGYVFQEPRLFPHLSVLDNVAFGPCARGRSKSESRTQVARWIETLDLGPFARRRPAELSGGQRQRVALARALATEPTLLLLDEPSAALDVDTSALIRSIVRSANTTTVLVTHDRAEADEVADAVITIDAPAAGST